MTDHRKELSENIHSSSGELFNNNASIYLVKYYVHEEQCNMVLIN